MLATKINGTEKLARANSKLVHILLDMPLLGQLLVACFAVSHTSLIASVSAALHLAVGSIFVCA